MMFRRLALALLLLLMAVPANAACYQWSKTTSANATADPSINWSVGMAPSGVDASGRAMMARLAECRDDVSGLLITTGTSTAYALATNQGLPSPPPDGQMLAFTVHTTNGAAATLTVDTGTAYPLQTSVGSGVAAGTLIASSTYTVRFSLANSVWVLRDFYGSPTSVPIGGLIPYFGATAPNANFILPAGQCLNRITYATFFAQVGTRFSVCDGTNTFGAPDMRGKTIAAIDSLGGTPAGNLTTTYFGADPTVIGNSGGLQTSTLQPVNLPPYTPSGGVGLGTLGVTSPIKDFNVTLGGSGSALFDPNSFGGVSGNLPGSISGTPTFAGTPQGGTSTPFANIPPAMVVTYLLRVL